MPAGGEIAATGTVAMRTGMLAGRLAQTVAPYPTYAVALRVAATRLLGGHGGLSWQPARPDLPALEGRRRRAWKAGPDGARPAASPDVASVG